MKVVGNSALLFETIRPKLTPDDDPALWNAALSVFAAELTQRYAEESGQGGWVMVVGTCSHWVRPHNSRWNRAGGFVCPEGYKDSVPELNWSEIFIFRNQEWTSAAKLPGKNIRSFRVAIPARTARHKQAAIHTLWTPKRETVLYGFREVADEWQCVASSDEKPKGPVRVEA